MFAIATSKTTLLRKVFRVGMTKEQVSTTYLKQVSGASSRQTFAVEALVFRVLEGIRSDSVSHYPTSFDATFDLYRRKAIAVPAKVLDVFKLIYLLVSAVVDTSSYIHVDGQQQDADLQELLKNTNQSIHLNSKVR